MEDKIKEELHQFLKDYGRPEAMQSPGAAIYDTQIKNFSVSLSAVIDETTEGTVVDIGSGRGILLNRLTSIDSFQNKRGWNYLAFDVPENLSDIIKDSVDLGIHKRVDALPLSDLEIERQPDSLKAFPRPFVFVCRNVLHELAIAETATLFCNISAAARQGESFFLQDLQKFPAAERGNACWQPLLLKNVIIDSGFSASFTEEPTKSGNQWFTFLGKRKESTNIPHAKILQSVIKNRTDQYNLWKNQNEILPGDIEARNNVALVDFDLQIAALHKQLDFAKAPGIAAPTKQEQTHVAIATLKQQLERFDCSVQFAPTSTRILDGFRDRANSQDALETFLLSSKQLTIIRGGPFMGKSVLVSEVLHRRAHHRKSVFFDITFSTTVWSILEQYLTQVGIQITYDLIQHFCDIEYSHVRKLFVDFFEKLASRSILIFDHFERLLDPNGLVQDKEIQELLTDLTIHLETKVIVTTRSDPNLHFLPASIEVDYEQPPVGRFPKGEHIRNVLDDYVDRAKLHISEYPASLIDAIDRVPYLAAIAGKIIQLEGSPVIQDEAFLDLLRNRLREELYQRVITEESKQAVEIVELLRGPIPRSMLIELASSRSVIEAERLGLIYHVNDNARDDLVSGIVVLHNRLKDEDIEEIDPTSVKGNPLDLKHKSIAESYQRLYRHDNNPRWIRECYFHKLAAGDPSDIEQFGVVYRGELFWAGTYWFKRHFNYDAALAAFLAAQKLGLNSYELELRIAACLFRVNRIREGEKYYSDLILHFSDARGVKTSFIDSYLAINEHKRALEKLEEFGFTITTSDWIAHEYGRAYLGLHNYQDAISAFEAELKGTQRANTYLELATSYRRMGNRDEVGRVLNNALKRYPNHFRILVSYAAHLIQVSETTGMDDAEAILIRLLDKSPGSGRVLQQLCKLYRIRHRVDEARRLLDEQNNKIYPEHYRSPIFVEVLMAEERWEDAVKELANIDLSDVHLVGQKKMVYLSWAVSTGRQEAMKIAQQGLDIKMDSSLLSNVPLLVTHARLANIANNEEELRKTKKILESINPNILDSVTEWSETEEDYFSSWDDI